MIAPEEIVREPGGRLRTEAAGGPWADHASAWLQWLAAEASVEERTEGLQAARGGLVDAIEFAGGICTATVREKGTRPARVRIVAPQLEAAAIERLAAGLAADRAAASELLVGTLPPAAEDLLAREGSSLRPGADAGWSAACNCGRPHPCRHLVAVAFLLQERFSDDPWRLPALRGLRRQDLEERVRIARRSEAVTASGGDGNRLAEGSFLEISPTDFWRPGPDLSRAEQEEPQPHPPLALLRRLGPSTIEGRFPLVGLLASAYEVIAARGRELGQAGDLAEPQREQGSDETIETDETVDRNGLAAETE